jgi:hypothetical protein
MIGSMSYAPPSSPEEHPPPPPPGGVITGFEGCLSVFRWAESLPSCGAFLRSR